MSYARKWIKILSHLRSGNKERDDRKGRSRGGENSSGCEEPREDAGQEVLSLRRCNLLHWVTATSGKDKVSCRGSVFYVHP